MSDLTEGQTPAQSEPTEAAPRSVTAKVFCSGKSFSASKGAGPSGASVTFACDYADGRNKEWAQYTPSLSLTMQVKNPDLFELGRAYTLTFTPDEG